MYRSKREVDKFVQDLNEKNKNEEERGLKGFTVAKLYYQVGEYQPALTYLDKYDKYRTNSAASFKLRGQVYQALAQSATLDASEKTQLQNLALQSYRRSVESDLSQTDLLLTIAELMLNLPIEEQGKARYWLEEAEKIFPNNKTLKNLRLKIQRAKEGLGTEDTQSEEEGRGEVNGNGAHGNDSDDNSAFWSANTGGGSSFLNNSRLDMRAETTSTPRIGSGSLLANNQSRRFIPRPSPERLANQIKSVEVAQEKMLAVIHEQSKANHETNEAILHEIRTSSEHAQKFNKDLLDTQTALLCEIRGFRDESNRQIRDNTRALKDVKSELVSLCDDMMRQLKTLVAAMKASRDEVDEEKSKQAAATAKAPPPKPDLPDINDLLLQQWSRLPPVHQLAILQMQGHLAATEAGMLAAARSAAVLPHVMPSVQNLNVQQAQQVPVQANPLQQIPLAQPNVPFQQTQRPPASVFDMGLTGASSGGNPWPSSSPSPQFPLPSISQPVVSTPSSSSTPSKETSILKPSIIGTPVNKPATGPSTPASGAFNLNVVKSTPPVSAAPTIVNPTPIPAAVKVSEPNRNSPFSTFASSPFAPASNVTPKPAAPKTDTAHSEFFASLGAPHTPQTGFNFGVPSPAPNVVPKKDLAAFSFAGAAAEAAQRAAASEDQDGDASGAHDESVEHDPQFEPIIPLPELVQVKTGEEEEEELFGFKAKMYRYDPESKEWKERGVGKIKILKHPVKGTFRVLLRREQIFKIAANHFITKDIELKPMASSTTALCYYAMDFADEELKLEHLAVRFKLEETKDEFKKVFEECQEELRKKGTPVKKDDSTPVKTEAEKQKPQDVKKDLSSLEQFKPKTGSWECSGCLCLNGADVIVCPACQTAKPGHEEEAKKATSSGLSKFGGGPPSGGFNLSGSAGGVVSSTQSGFKFGVDATSTNAATANQGAGFTFGTPVTATKAPTTSAAVTAAPTSGFTFGTPVAQSTAGATTTTTTAPTSGFTFGGGAAAAAVKPSGFTFGKPAETKPAASPAASGFTFGKPAETSTPQTSTLLPATTTPQSSFSFGKPVSPKPETTAPAEAKPSPFAAFSFGLKPAASSETEATESKGVDLSASKNLASFADLATSTGTGFGFGGTKSNFAFTGAGAPVFGQAGQKKDSTPNETGADDETPDDADHDPHFEPIIPLPELVQVKTGEEEEEELFGHKAKMYRYDPETKEWKERGVGKLKILKHPTKGTYRVLLRREQVHKIAANHMITKDIEIKPMSTSTTAICYYAMDFAEETLKLEHLAVRFKLEETLEQFKTVFKKCQEDLKTKSTPTKKDPSITEAIDPCQGLKNKVEELTSNLDMFKPKTDSWECPGCLCRNNADVIKCPSCETPKPGLENATPKVDNVTPKAETPAQSQAMSIFGGKPDTSGSGFSFAAFAPPPAASIFGGTKIEEIKTTATANDDELSFENQSLKLNTAADAAPVAAKISNTKNMKILTFSGNTVGIEAAEAIGKALETHPEFQRAHWKDMFTGRMKTEIPPALKHLSRGIMAANAHLVELDLSDNAFGPIGAEGIVDLLKSPSCFTLQEIRLNNTGCGVTGGKLLAKTLLECYHNSGKKLALKVFVLGRSRQENEGAKALAQVFKLMGSLEEVVMPQNGIYHEGIAALSDAFANNPNLRILNMNDNTFTEKGAQALAKALPKMQQLYVLNLGDCLLRTQGAKLLANALKAGHSNLEELYLDSNEIRSEGGLAVVEAMANKFKLQKLKLDGNQFGSDGCGTILQKLKQIGKQQVMEEIEDDEEPDEDEDENVSVDRAQLATGEDDEEDEDEDDEEYEDEDDENEEEEESNIMFEGTCNFFERIPSENGETSEESSLGKVDLKILYDDDVYGARILATEHQPDDTPTQNGSDVVPQTICNHLIAIQTVLSPKDDFRKMEWSALDFSKDPPVYRHFAAQFDREELGQEFRDIFTEGKDLAEQSEILEQPDMNPEEMYYGQGGDYEEEES